MKIAKFTDVKYILENTALDENIDPALIDSTIMSAQNIYIQQVVGERLYRKLMFDVATKVIELEYLELISDYIKPTLAMWVYYSIIPLINYRLTNKSIAEKSSDTSAATSLDVVKFLQDNAKNEAEFYSKRLSDYLENNCTMFPEFGANKDNELKPNFRYESGIYIEKKHRKK